MMGETTRGTLPRGSDRLAPQDPWPGEAGVQEIHVPPEDVLELLADRDDVVQAKRCARLGLDEDVDDRSEPRDLFDLWAGLCRFGVAFDEIAVGYRAKYGSPPGTWRLERALAMKADWERRLAHQVGDLPSFEEAYGAIRARVEEWLARSSGA